MISGKKTKKEKKTLSDQLNNQNSNSCHHSKKVVVIGGANIDVKGKSFNQLEKITSNPGAVNIALGGVGRNIAHNLALLAVPVIFLSVVGNDDWGRKILEDTGELVEDKMFYVIHIINPTGDLINTLNGKNSWITEEEFQKVSEAYAALADSEELQ